MPAALELSRAQILAFRRRVGALDRRLPRGRRSLRRAAWAGLQDSMPRAALLSIHARVPGTSSTTWEDPSLVQVWGPRYSAYVVAATDLAIFTLGRLPERGATRRTAEDLAARLRERLGEAAVPYGEAGAALGEPPNRLRYAALTGTVAMRWEGARQPTIRVVPPPELGAREARLELVRRYLHVFGPATPSSFSEWAGIGAREGVEAFEALGRSTLQARTPVGEAWILARDERVMREPADAPAPARLLPSGDTYFLLQGADRALLVPDAGRRRRLWTSRVWPGAVLAEGEVVGTWRRDRGIVSISPWGRLPRAAREAIEAEAASFPLPGLDRPIEVRWDR